MKNTLIAIAAAVATATLSGCAGIREEIRAEQASPYYPYTSFMNRTMFMPRQDVTPAQTNHDIRECVGYVKEVDTSKEAGYARGMSAVSGLSGGIANKVESDRATEKVKTMRSDVLRNCLQAKGYKTLF
jgi:hypothetical protein